MTGRSRILRRPKPKRATMLSRRGLFELGLSKVAFPFAAAS